MRSAGRERRAGGRLPTLLGLASFALLAALVAGGAVAEAVFALLAAAFPVGLIALGIAGRPVRRVTIVALLLLLLLLVGSMALLLALRGGAAPPPRLAGLPLPLAVLLLGVWLVPLVLTGLAYALGFDAAGLPTARRRASRASMSRPPGDSRPDADPAR